MPHHRPSVKDSDHCSHILGCANGGQTSDATSNDLHLCRRHSPCCGDLASEEAPKLIGRLHNCPAANQTPDQLSQEEEEQKKKQTNKKKEETVEKEEKKRNLIALAKRQGWLHAHYNGNDQMSIKLGNQALCINLQLHHCCMVVEAI